MRPVLSPMASSRTPSRSSSVRYRLFIGVSSRRRRAGPGEQAAAPADEQHRQILVRVPVAVGDAAAVHDHASDRAASPSPSGVAFSLLMKYANSSMWSTLICVDALDPVLLVPVVRQRVVRIGHADLRVRAQAAFAADHQRRRRASGRPGTRRPAGRTSASRSRRRARACRVGLSMPGRQVAHVLLGDLDPPLDFANRRQVLVELAAVDGAEVGRRASCVRSQHQRRGCCGGSIVRRARVSASSPVSSRAEQALEGEPRIGLGRHRRRRAAPGQAVGVRAAVARVAVADGARVVAAQLDRAEPRLVADVLRRRSDRPRRRSGCRRPRSSSGARR